MLYNYRLSGADPVARIRVSDAERSFWLRLKFVYPSYHEVALCFLSTNKHTSGSHSASRVQLQEFSFKSPASCDRSW